MALESSPRPWPETLGLTSSLLAVVPGVNEKSSALLLTRMTTPCHPVPAELVGPATQGPEPWHKDPASFFAAWPIGPFP